jgi:DNA repair exonuclease SbcCD ATPase subunit
MTEPQGNGAKSIPQARWMGQMEAKIEATIRDLEERDKRYDERAKAQDTAVSAALAAQQEAVAAALAASDKAVDKAEINAEKWRDQANEWRGAMSDRDRELPSRRELEALLTGLQSSIGEIKQDMERLKGERKAMKETRERVDITTGQIIAVTAVIAAAVVGSAGIIVAVVS